MIQAFPKAGSGHRCGRAPPRAVTYSMLPHILCRRPPRDLVRVVCRFFRAGLLSALFIAVLGLRSPTVHGQGHFPSALEKPQVQSW